MVPPSDAAPVTSPRRLQALASPLAAVLLACCHAQAPGTTGPTEPVLRIFLARHGQTDWNAARRLQGWTDVALNAVGRSQAQELARSLDGVPMDRIYCSALRRSRETAEAVSGGRIPVEVKPGLNEQKLGKFEGVYLDGRDPGAATEYGRRSADSEDSLDGGESRSSHHERVRGVVDEILRRHPGGSVLVVGHGGTNAAILGALLGLSLEEASAIHQANDEIYMIEISPGREPLLWKRVSRDRLGEL